MVHVGVRPSGRMHMGNVLTAVYAARMGDVLLSVNRYDGDNDVPYGLPLIHRERFGERMASVDQMVAFLEKRAKVTRINTDEIDMMPLIHVLYQKKAEVEKVQEGGILPYDPTTQQFAEESWYDGTLHARSGDHEFVYNGGPFIAPAAIKLALKHAALDETVFVLGGNYRHVLDKKMAAIGEILGSSASYETGPLLVDRYAMSKSRGNVVTLAEVLKDHEEDVVWDVLSQALDEGKSSVNWNLLREELKRK